MTKFHCRFAERTDAPALADMRWRLKTDDEPAPDPNAYESFVNAFVAWSDQPESHNCHHWIVERDGAAVGAMSVVVVDKPPAPGELVGRWGYLTNSYVYPEGRDSGAGALLLTHIKEWARENELELLLVWPSERAYPFYERAGFRSTRDPLVLQLGDERR